MSTDTQEPHSDESTAPNDTPNTETEIHDSAPTAFTATINVGRMQRFLDAIRVLDEECRLRLSPTGISAHVVDPANTTVVEARLDASAFEAYDTNGDTGVVGISVSRLRKIVRMSSNRDMMEFDLIDARTLRVRTGALECPLQLTDPARIRSTDSPEDTEYSAVVVLEGGEWKRIVKAAGHVDTAVDLQVETNDERFVARATDGDDSLRAPRKADDLMELFVGNEPVESRFNLSYLRKAKRAIRKHTEVTLGLGTDLPLSVEFDIVDGAGHVEYGIAPMVDAT